MIFFQRGSWFGFSPSAGQSSVQVEGSRGFFFLLKLTFTKTTRGSATSPFILETFEDLGVCPVAWIEYYLSVCNLLNIVLNRGYFFRTTDRGRVVSKKTFLGFCG